MADLVSADLQLVVKSVRKALVRKTGCPVGGTGALVISGCSYSIYNFTRSLRCLVQRAQWMMQILASGLFAVKMRLAMLCAGACVAASHAFAGSPAFCLAKNSWTCAGPGPWIGKLDSLDPHSPKSRDLASYDKARCMSYPWLDPDAQAFVHNKVTVMLVEEPYAYVCRKVVSDGVTIIGCEYALTSDIRDSNWRRVSHYDLERSARSTTAYDIVDFSPCPLPPNAELSR